MCLINLDNRPKVRGFGWKVVRVQSGQDGTVYSSPVRGFGYTYYTKGEWVRDGRPARMKIGTDRPGVHYTTGFHIFRTRRGAESYINGCGRSDFKIARVEYCRVVASGTQRTQWRRYARTVVARSFKILEVEGE